MVMKGDVICDVQGRKTGITPRERWFLAGVPTGVRDTHNQEKTHAFPILNAVILQHFIRIRNTVTALLSFVCFSDGRTEPIGPLPRRDNDSYGSAYALKHTTTSLPPTGNIIVVVVEVRDVGSLLSGFGSVSSCAALEALPAASSTRH
jgi:hypothetical protein